MLLSRLHLLLSTRLAQVVNLGLFAMVYFQVFLGYYFAFIFGTKF